MTQDMTTTSSIISAPLMAAAVLLADWLGIVKDWLSLVLVIATIIYTVIKIVKEVKPNKNNTNEVDS